ncbi:unnamed protein product [Rangifer tarandus platyrhynchus]|uniref:Uncharacterized protein n=1 Tax=Rangifer tarandus platyrhynchus TaxID=3082113 RepID=A0ABN8YI99_RANTA|nr:unnamed protein product [Rangifer tarandus platyrhynchus]
MGCSEPDTRSAARDTGRNGSGGPTQLVRSALRTQRRPGPSGLWSLAVCVGGSCCRLLRWLRLSIGANGSADVHLLPLSRPPRWGTPALAELPVRLGSFPPTESGPGRAQLHRAAEPRAAAAETALSEPGRRKRRAPPWSLRSTTRGHRSETPTLCT